MSKSASQTHGAVQWSLWRLLTLLTAACFLLGVLRLLGPFEEFAPALLIVAGWLLSGLAMIACLLLLQAPLFLLVRWRLRGGELLKDCDAKGRRAGLAASIPAEDGK